MNGYKSTVLKTKMVSLDGKDVETVSIADLYHAAGMKSSVYQWFYSKKGSLKLVDGVNYKRLHRDDYLVPLSVADKIISRMPLAREPVSRLAGYDVGFRPAAFASIAGSTTLTTKDAPRHPSGVAWIDKRADLFGERIESVEVVESYPMPAAAFDAAPKLTADGDRIVTDSRDVAEFFGKRHGHVLDSIREIIENSPKTRLPNFRQSSFLNDQRHEMPCYEMDRDAFSLLAMGFTGTKALQWKLRYIEAFNLMEAELKKPERAATFDPTDPASLLHWVTHYAQRTLTAETKAIELESKVAEDAPKIAALERIADRPGDLTITQTAKDLKVAPRFLFDLMHESGWLYAKSKQNNHTAIQAVIDRGYLIHHDFFYNDRGGIEQTSHHAKVTPAGKVALARLIERKAA